MRTIVISDIHGHYNEFIELLKLVEYTKGKDKLYLLGDYVDKGKQGKEVIQFVMELSKYEGVKVIGGNHDDMFLNWVKNNDFLPSPYTNDMNSGTETILSFVPYFKSGINDAAVRQIINESYFKEIKFLKNLPYFIEDDHHIYVHAGIDPTQKNWKNTTPKQFRWIREPFYTSKITNKKKIVFGHTVTALMREESNDFSIWFANNKIGIDGGVKFGGQLNALIIENEKYSSSFVKIPVK